MVKIHHYTDVPAQPVEGSPGVTIRWVLGKNVGTPNFSTRVIEVAPGASTERHGHAWEHEVFILEGQATVWHADGETVAGPGTCIYISPYEIHEFRNAGDSLLRLICIVPNTMPRLG